MPIPIRRVLDDAKALFGQHPELGRTATVATAELVDQVRTSVRVGRYSFETDEARVGGGGAAAPSPIELALGAVAACHAVVFRYWSELLDAPFDAVAIQVRGEGDVQGLFGVNPSAPPVLAKVSVVARIRGPLPAERYRELHDAVQARSPLFVALCDGIPIASQLIVH